MFTEWIPIVTIVISLAGGQTHEHHYPYKERFSSRRACEGAKEDAAVSAIRKASREGVLPKDGETPVFTICKRFHIV